MVKCSSMEPVTNPIYRALDHLKARKIEAIFLASASVTCLASTALMVFSFISASHASKKGYYEAPKKKPSGLKVPAFERATEVVVEIAGAVNRPGVYHLPKPARINDLLVRANGLSKQANKGYVSRSLNLAQTLNDQEKIYIPELGEEAPAVSNIIPQSAIVQNTANELSEGPLLNVNSASKSELENLPGIGEITAEKIIEGRPYTSVEELSKNGVLKKNIFDGLKEKISI